MIRGVMFDNDGVLIDSERLGMDAFNRACRLRGFDAGDCYYRLLGLTSQANREICLQAFGPSFPVEELLPLINQTQTAAAEDGTMPLKPGMEECMKELKSMGIKIAMATSTHRKRVEKYLSGIPAFRGCFDAVICGNEVKSSKPSPEIYLAAAKALRLSPEECMGVEDSRAGVEAVNRSGAFCVMIPDLLPYGTDFEPWVHRVLPSLTELPALIAELNRQ